MSVHNFGICEKRIAAQWQNPIFPASKHVCFSEVAEKCHGELRHGI